VRRIIAILLGSLSLLALAAPGPAIALPGNEKWALLIGVGDYAGNTVSTPGSKQDALDTRSFLGEKGWPQSQMRVLVDEQATAPAIREGLDWLVSHCGPGSSCVFKHSGHVKQARANDGDTESLDEGLWTYENAFIWDGELGQKLSQLKGNAWFDFSGCEAAGFDDGLSSPQHLVTASSQENEKSYESPEWGNSVWTELLVNRGLRGGSSMEQAIDSATQQAPLATAGQRKGAQHPYRSGGADTSWLDRGAQATPAAAAPKNCLLLFICL